MQTNISSNIPRSSVPQGHVESSTPTFPSNMTIPKDIKLLS